MNTEDLEVDMQVLYKNEKFRVKAVGMYFIELRNRDNYALVFNHNIHLINKVSKIKSKVRRL